MSITVLGSYIHAHCLGVHGLPQSGESMMADCLWSDFGGKGLNLALGLNQLGVDVYTLLAVGVDAEAQGLQAYLKTVGLNTDGLTIVDDRSGFGVGLVSSHGENMIVIYPGANHLLNAQHIYQATARIQASQLVCAQFELLDEPIMAAFTLAKQAGVKTLLNPSPWRAIPSELLGLTDILVLNYTEAVAFFNLDIKQIIDWQAVLTQYIWQGELVIVTLGEQGCVAHHAQYGYCAQTAWTIQQVDATGAGDAFTVGLMYALMHNQILAEALSWANACGAIVASQRGVAEVLPDVATLEAFVNSVRSNVK